MEKLLIIAYWFPPAGGIAVQRALSFVRYLPACGYEVHVLTAKNPPSPVRDESLLKRIPENVCVHRVITPMPPAAYRQKMWSLVSRAKSVPYHPGKPAPAAAEHSWKSLVNDMAHRVLSPDPEVVWTPLAKRAARRIIREHNIGTVLITAPPFSAFLIGIALKAEFPGLKLVSDFRDEWLNFYLSYLEFHRSPHIRRKAERIERQTVECADLVLSVTPSLIKVIRERYPDQPDSKFACLPNGYDPELFLGFHSRRHERPSVVVTHVGTVTKSNSPRTFFEAVGKLPAEVAARLTIRFVGRVTEAERHVLDGRHAAVELLGFVPQRQAIAFMEDTDYLLLIMHDGGFATGKVYEYLATGKRILALSPLGGEVDLVLQETGAGSCVDPQDIEGIGRMLRTAVERVASQEEPAVNWESIRRYERPRLAAELGQLLRECTK